MKSKRLSDRQLAVIDDIFAAEVDETEILKKHRISRRVFNNWLKEGIFNAEFARRIEAAYRQSELIIAKYTPLAAAKLVELTESEKEETRRKACLDIISLPKPGLEISEGPRETLNEGLTEEMAAKLLRALAK